MKSRRPRATPDDIRKKSRIPSASAMALQKRLSPCQGDACIQCMEEKIKGTVHTKEWVSLHLPHLVPLQLCRFSGRKSTTSRS